MDVERPVHDSLCKSATPDARPFLRSPRHRYRPRERSDATRSRGPDAMSFFALPRQTTPSSRAKRSDPVPMPPRQPGGAPCPAAVSGSLRCARDDGIVLQVITLWMWNVRCTTACASPRPPMPRPFLRPPRHRYRHREQSDAIQCRCRRGNPAPLRVPPPCLDRFAALAM